MGTTIFYVLTMAALAAYWGTACVSGFAFASSGRRIYLVIAALFVVYSIETCELFFNEFTLQGTVMNTREYYQIAFPVARTLVAALAQGCIQTAAMWLTDRDNLKSVVAWGVVFFLVSMGIVWFMPYGPVRQYLYYSVRQVALAGTLVHLGVVYRTTQSVALKTRLSKYLKRYAALWALLAGIVIEDTLVILVVPMSAMRVWSLVFLSDRNTCEAVMSIVLAVWVVKHAYHLLSIRLREVPTSDKVDKLEDHIEEQMDRMRERFKLSERETEVLRLVVLGKTNHEIATALYLAEGTVKKHVHNIMVKSETKSREALTIAFWKA